MANKYAAQAREAKKKRRQERAEDACQRKVRYDSKEEADAQRGQRPYHCGLCGSWHRATILKGVPRRTK